jgi:hypothetical protein
MIATSAISQNFKIKKKNCSFILLTLSIISAFLLLAKFPQSTKFKTKWGGDFRKQLLKFWKNSANFFETMKLEGKKGINK